MMISPGSTSAAGAAASAAAGECGTAPAVSVGVGVACGLVWANAGTVSAINPLDSSHSDLGISSSRTRLASARSKHANPWLICLKVS